LAGGFKGGSLRRGNLGETTQKPFIKRKKVVQEKDRQYTKAFVAERFGGKVGGQGMVTQGPSVQRATVRAEGRKFRKMKKIKGL